MRPWIWIVVYLAEEPALSAECDRVDNHVDEGKKENREQRDGPACSCSERELHPNHADTSPDVSRRGENESQRHAVARIQKKGKRERIHKRNIEDVQFPPDC